MTKSTTCLKVPKRDGQKTIELANKFKLMDRTLQIQRNESDIVIPLAREPNQDELAKLQSQVPEIELCKEDFTEKQASTESLEQALEGKLSPHLLASLPRAIDVIGDIAVIEVPSKLQQKQVLMGQAILETHKNIKTVLAKASAINGTFRLREFAFVAGENKTQTTHKEFGCSYQVDLANAYFSPRLSHEHARVAALVRPGETIVDLFAGVGPFSVLIAKKNLNAKVYSVDINPDAFELLKVNVRINRVENRVFPILGDAREITETKLRSVADRVIMNLPETALEFVDAACRAIKPQGGIIHFYSFVRQPDSIENKKQEFNQALEKNGRKVKKFFYAKSIRETAPYESQVVLDAEIV